MRLSSSRPSAGRSAFQVSRRRPPGRHVVEYRCARRGSRRGHDAHAFVPDWATLSRYRIRHLLVGPRQEFTAPPNMSAFRCGDVSTPLGCLVGLDVDLCDKSISSVRSAGASSTARILVLIPASLGIIAERASRGRRGGDLGLYRRQIMSNRAGDLVRVDAVGAIPMPGSTWCTAQTTSRPWYGFG